VLYKLDYYFFVFASTKPADYNIVSKVYNCSDGHISELATEARNEIAFPFWRATESNWNRNMVSLVSSVTELMRLPISETRSTAS